MSFTPNVIKESARGYQSIAIEDYHMKNRKIFLTEEVTSETSASLIKQLLYLDSEETGKEITLYINSPGGDVSSGLAVYDTIKFIESPVKTVVIGSAESMGAILFLAGEKRELHVNSKVLIHDPSYSSGSFANKKPDQLKAKLDDLVEVQEKLCNIIAERTGKTLEEIKNITKDDTYFNAEEAVSFGLATAIIGKENL